MVIITFKHSEDWYYPNWVYRKLVSETKCRYDDSDAVFTLEQAGYQGALFADSIDPKLRKDIFSALLETCDLVGAREQQQIDHFGDDVQAASIYVRSCKELRDKIIKEVEPQRSSAFDVVEPPRPKDSHT